jgi:hypothetical protein
VKLNDTDKNIVEVGHYVLIAQSAIWIWHFVHSQERSTKIKQTLTQYTLKK